MVFGIAPPCDGCERPTLAPDNLAAWEIYRLINGQFCQDYVVDVFEVMRRFRVSQETAMLSKLTLIHRIARKNAERSAGGESAG